MKKMFVYSGKVKLCEVGLPIGKEDDLGSPIYTGDIVLLYTMYDNCLVGINTIENATVVVFDQYGGLSNKPENVVNAYPMGIKDAFLWEDPTWNVRILKKHDVVVNNEQWYSSVITFKEEEI